MNHGKQFGQWVRDVRASVGLSQVKFAELIEACSGDLVSRWENGYHYPHRDTVEEIARIANQVSGKTASSFKGARFAAAQVAASPKKSPRKERRACKRSTAQRSRKFA